MGMQKKNVLIVEDNEEHLELMCRAFAPDSLFQVFPVSEVGDARAVAENNPLALMLIDYKLTGSKGTDLLDEYADKYPIVIITSFGDQELAVQIMKKGAIDYLVKSAETFLTLPKIARSAIREWNLIQEKKNAENALRQSESQYRLLFENMMSGFILCEAITGDNNLPVDFRILATNSIFEKMIGTNDGRLHGKFISEVMPDISKNIFDFFIKTAYENKTFEFEHYISPLRRHLRYRLFCPQHTQLAAIFEDITIQKQHEHIQHKNTRRMRSQIELGNMKTASRFELFDFALAEAIDLTDSKIGFICFYNEKSRQFTLNSWSNSAMKECSVQDKPIVYDLDNTGLWGEAVRQRKYIITNDYQQPNPFKKGIPEGHVAMIRFMNVPLTRSNEIVLVVAVANKETDYTEADVIQLQLLMESTWEIYERKKVQEELQISEENFRNIFNGSSDPIIISDFQSIILDSNKKFEQMFALNKKENASVTFRMNEESCITWAAMMSQTGRKETPPFELTMQNQSGVWRYFEAVIQLIKYNNQNAVLTMLRDITERKFLENTVLKAVIATEEKERDRIARDLHDGVGPLLSTAKLVLQTHLSMPDGDEKKQLGDKAVNLVSDSITSISEISYNLSPHVLNKYGLIKAIETFIAKIRDGVPVEIRLEHNEPGRMNNTVEIILYRIIIELINNCLKHANAKSVKIEVYKLDDNLEIKYSDNGCGFKVDEKIERPMGMGLKNIINRVRSVNGSVTFHDNNGIEIGINIPNISTL